MFGPDTPLVSLELEAIPLEVEAATLGEAIAAYEAAFAVSITPYDGRFADLPWDPADPKWFIYASRRPKWEEVVVDIHVERNGESLCPRQNLHFALEASDVIHIGMLVC